MNMNEILFLVTILTSIFAYYGITSKKPRLFFKITPVFMDKEFYLNLCIINCGDKPAFDIKITLNKSLYDLINLYDPLELNKINSSINFKKNKPDFLMEFKAERLNLLNYYQIKKNTKDCLDSCFNNCIKFISGGQEELVYLGKQSKIKGFLKNSFSLDANISFYEELKIDIITNYILKLIITIPIFLYISLLSFIYIFNIFPIKFYFFNYKNEINKASHIYINNFVEVDLKNRRIKINYSYDYVVNVNENYTYKAVDKNFEEKIDMICKYINLKTEGLFFNYNLYSTWESKLTKDELNIMKIYRFKYLNDYDKYINLYGKIYTNSCDKIIKNKEGFKKKYETLITIMYHSGFLTEHQKNSIRLIYVKYLKIKKNKGVKL